MTCVLYGECDSKSELSIAWMVGKCVLFHRDHLPSLCGAAVVFRYNAVSLMYLLFLLASFLLPSTRNSAHSGAVYRHVCVVCVC